ncbi:sensor histidine kinase [Spirillospora sp. CA-142024]|uniref:sensor histidine kinase n=1 Tax=Spirillospora sp. CA-142024 TaxID=3240036 RepID=UPI003D8C3F55
MATRLTRFLTRRIGRLERALEKQRRFASEVSHELRNPIAGLRARLEEAQLYPDQTSMDELVEEALHDVRRLEAIVTDLRLLSQAEATNGDNGSGGRKPEVMDLAELVASELAHRPDQLAAGQALEPGVTVTGVRGEIARVLANLLDNAQRHAKRKVVVEACRNGDSAELIVSDDGDGIAAADREKIFQRFVRLDASRERDRDGTGLGLGISREIAHAHHGTLEVGESTSGGARFVLRLPLTRVTPADGSRRNEPLQNHPAQH